jgi:hypothetical protein
MFGYATDETAEMLPLTVLLAHKLNMELAKRRRDGSMPWLLPDSSYLPLSSDIDYRNTSYNRISKRFCWTSNPSQNQHNRHLNATCRNNLPRLPTEPNALGINSSSHPRPSPRRSDNLPHQSRWPFRHWRTSRGCRFDRP